ncbi:MAG: 2-oxo acid dehydrogenase subunit E2 [Actinomycetota bacterium]|nr:2-oxo acid dehydrogenase subunit E2 [Actinomycetota bacterium]
MPQMGVSVAEGTVVEWKKQPGDWVERDEIICSISTDKIDTDVESPAAGRVSELLVDVGATVEVGVVLARIATDAKPGEPHASENGAGTSSGPVEGTTTEASSALGAHGEAGELVGDTTADHDETVTEKTPVPRKGGARRYSPVVMRIAAEHGIDLEQVEGTGRDGRVRKQDVLAFMENGGGGATAEDTQPTSSAGTGEPPMHIESPYRPDPVPPKAKAAPAPAPAPTAAPSPAPQPVAAAPIGEDLGAYEQAPLSRMRQNIGRRMLESLQTTATCTTIVECDMGRIEAARAKSGLTYLPYVAAATVQTLREEQFRSLNATLEGETFTQYEAVHLGIAVSLGTGGLIVPVIHHAQDLSVEGVGRRIKELAKKARSNALTPDDVRGGTFTITNPGLYGAIMATPVINQPQVAILDCEAVVKRPVVVTDEAGSDSIAIRPMTYFPMSWDHRALDGALAAQFLTALRKRLEAWPV